jgi:hypothetical protein
MVGVHAAGGKLNRDVAILVRRWPKQVPQGPVDRASALLRPSP